jgi:DNA modification methylase
VLADIGFADAVIARRTPQGLELLDGHLRAELEPDQLLPVLVTDLDEAEADVLLASLDPLASMAEADQAMLTSLIEETELSSELLEHLKTDYLGGLGWIRPSKVGPDSVPRTAKARTRPGDLWALGEHRLLCGDATSPADVGRLMGTEHAALMATDPPYAVAYTGADRPGQGKDWSELYQDVSPEGAEELFRGFLVPALQVLVPRAPLYVWLAHRHLALLSRIWDELGVLNHQELIWVKPVATSTHAFWPWRHEPCLLGWRRGHKPRHDGRNAHDQTSVWECDYDGRCRAIGNEHPTQKPVELFRRPILKHTRAGEICYEPFAGSGTTIIAADDTGRRCYALELTPAFCDLAIRRYEEFTGRKPELLERAPTPRRSRAGTTRKEPVSRGRAKAKAEATKTAHDKAARRSSPRTRSNSS